MNDQAVIIINPRCHQGGGWKRWLSIRNEVLQSFHCPVEQYVLEKGIEIDTLIKDLSYLDRNYIISAGGDGSMHLLANTLLNNPSVNRDNIILGAIGLGSSNDFLKPFRRKIKNIPVRINYRGNYKEHDAGIATFLDSNDQ